VTVVGTHRWDCSASTVIGDARPYLDQPAIRRNSTGKPAHGQASWP
jgi:hypothetical protein